jgi:hypothetical protein
VSQYNLQQLEQFYQHIVARTERGNTVVRTDPRSMPRRLRVLLLAIDGTQTVDLYVHTLKGFGDIGELLVELLNLGLVMLVTNEQARAMISQAKPHVSELEQILDDSRFNSQAAADVLYGTTSPGSFDDMLRVARIERPDFTPPPAPPPAPVSARLQKAQIESLFDLLEKARGERRNLKAQLAKLQRIKTAARTLRRENDVLTRWVFGLGTACVALCITLLLLIVRR